MKTEKVIISFITTIIGIFVAGLAFYFYQTTKTVPEQEIKTLSASPSPKVTPKPSIFLTIHTPKDEEVTDKRTITVSGTTVSNATLIVTTPANDQVITAASNGNFSTTVVLENGENELTIVAIAPNGEEEKITQTISVSSETF